MKLLKDLRRAELVARRPASADAVARWAKDVFLREGGLSGLDGRSGLITSSTPSNRSTKSISSTKSTSPAYPEIAANGVLVLINVACSLLDRQISSLARTFEQEGGFTERLYKVRTARRRQ